MSTGEVGNGASAGGSGDASGGTADSAATGGAFTGTEGVQGGGNAGNVAVAGFGQPEATATPEYDPATPDWAKDFSPENRDAIVKNGFKSQDAIVDSYRELRKMQGDATYVKMPDMTNPESVSEFYGKLGRPAEAKDYQLGDFLNDVDDPMTQSFREMSHGINATQEQVTAMVSWVQEFAGHDTQLKDDAFNAQAIEAITKMKVEWGPDYEPRFTGAQNTLTKMGIGQDEVKAMEAILGTERMMRTFDIMAQAMNERPRQGEGNDTQAGQFSQDGAKLRLEELMANEDFTKRLYHENKEIRDQAAKERDNLAKIVHGT